MEKKKQLSVFKRSCLAIFECGTDSTWYRPGTSLACSFDFRMTSCKWEG